MLYAKRLLKQYWISDKELVQYIRTMNPSAEKIHDYEQFIKKLHNTINDEVNNWILELKKVNKKYFEMKGKI